MVHLRVGFGRAAGKTEGLDTTCPRTGSCTSSCTSLLVLQQERRRCAIDWGFLLFALLLFAPLPVSVG